MKKYIAVCSSILLIVTSFLIIMSQYNAAESEDVVRNSSGRTQDEYIEDFDYLFNQLEENFPFFGVSQRKYETDIEETYLRSRAVFNNYIRSDDHFMALLNFYFFQHLNGVGHLELLDRPVYYSLVSDYSHAVETAENDMWREHIEVYVETLNNPKSRAFYGEAPVYFENTDNLINHENVSVKIIEENKTAYIRIDSFGSRNIDTDREILFNFYEEVENYEHLIFDIRPNRGGSTWYATDLMIAPNIEETLSVPTYHFIKEAENNLKFMQAIPNIFLPISELNQNELPYINADDLNELDSFFRGEQQIEPLNDEKMFKGKIWLLVSEYNYSASEFAAMFSKNSGFATLVGETTGGDGIGRDSALIVLPNTGLIVRYSHIYGTDQYGRNSEEFGTDAHIFNEEGKDALETALDLIREGLY